MALSITDFKDCSRWLESLGVRDTVRGYANLLALSQTPGAPAREESEAPDQPNHSAGERAPQRLFRQLEETLPAVHDPDRALNNLERYFAAPTSPNPFSHSIANVMPLFSDSQYVSDLLIQDQISISDLLRSDGQPVARQSLARMLWEQMAGIENRAAATSALRTFKQQQTARIAMGDLVHHLPLETICQQISWLAESVCEGAYRWGHRDLVKKRGLPLTPSGRAARFVVLAMGKLGGTELNYSSDIDLVLAYDFDGQTDAIHPVSNREFFEQLTRDITHMLSEPMVDRPAYRVDLRLRPEGSRGKICSSYQSITHYYDFQGRTWERQALIKATPIAGDLLLGQQLIAELEPWVYQKHLNRVDIAGIKALKRRIERKSIERGDSETNVKTGHGGIRDIEFAIQFLQLLNGGVISNIRSPNTLRTILLLESEGILTPAESTLLTQNYRWLRKLEHRLQLMFDLQTHTLPADKGELLMLARRMGYTGPEAMAKFKSDLSELTSSNRTILNHLLHDAFGNTFGSLRDSGGHLAFSGDETVSAEVDLILEPEPDEALIGRVLAPYGFRNVPLAFENLMELANENTRFLSSRRCRHFLAAIAPVLLEEIASAPDPDATLVSLVSVSDSLGAKGVLWELFNFNPPTLSLCVRLCATSDYLARILISNPGMIDDLMDALQVEQLPTYEFLAESMAELVQGADDIEPIVYSFKHSQHLREGIRDILGRDDIRDTHRALADVADVCLQTVASHEFSKLIKQWTETESRERLNAPIPERSLDISNPFVILAMGKLGGQEPNYHSDLDLIFLYDNDKEFESRLPAGRDNQYFFSQLAANITQFITHSVQFGRLYELDSRLRPTGKNGPLAVSMDEFSRYFESGTGRLWERQSLCKARPVFGSPALKERAIAIVRQAILRDPWQPDMGKEIDETRRSMEQDCSERNLKRGAGGTVDVEFSVQMLQLKFCHQDPSVLVPGTLAALGNLVSRGFLGSESGDRLCENYQLLRNVESHLRLINTTARHDLPTDPMVLEKLAFLLAAESPDQLCESVARARCEIRQQYEAVLDSVSR